MAKIGGAPGKRGQASAVSYALEYNFFNEDAGAGPCTEVNMVLCGIDMLVEGDFRILNGRNPGLLINQASVDRKLFSTGDHFLSRQSFTTKALFGPQHGISGTTQDNMIEWQGFQDIRRNVPVYSLYGEVRKPAPSMLEGIDIFVIDLFDVGSRYYTFLWTAYLSLMACAERGISVLLLDRPNPIDGVSIEGPCLGEDFASFVGLYPLVIRHGMTMGEILKMIIKERRIDVDFEIIPVKGWKREMWFDDTELPWVMPSPNMPTLDTATVYPGFCLLEGTNLSEGRGTTRPFEFFGAPFIDPHLLVEDLNKEGLEGVFFRPAYFEPAFQKFKGIMCGGAQMHILSRERFSSVAAVAAVLKIIERRYPEHFRWNEPPYEYEYVKLPIDILAGGDSFRHHIEQDSPLADILKEWEKDRDEFRERRAEYLIYR